MSPGGSEPAKGRHEWWEAVYTSKSTAEVSWYQPEPEMSLSLIEEFGVPRDAAVLDVGGGTSTLADCLLARGFTDVSVLDVSETALETSRLRIGDRPEIKWFAGDLLAWQPINSVGLWHDRALFHFFVKRAQRAMYVSKMRAAISPGGVVILATFASDGPETCSGLPVARYDAGELVAILHDSFRVIARRREEHTTPAGAIQPFTWIVASMTPER
jgi:2-polyprenyl-3-methyl-5-hydroxy-6-metoxy-1,4-benzoquinol methylase